MECGANNHVYMSLTLWCDLWCNPHVGGVSVGSAGGAESAADLDALDVLRFRSKFLQVLMFGVPPTTVGWYIVRERFSH